MFAHVLATIERGAVGNHALAINAALESHGIAYRMFAETVRPEFEGSVSTMSELADVLGPQDTVLYQFANPSPIADVLYDSRCRLYINYHNVTPAHFFSRWSPHTSAAVSRARAQLARLVPLCRGAVAVSRFNASELRDLGCQNIDVIPPIFSETFYTAGQASPQGSSWIYVGRIAPHKNVHTVLRAFELYKQYHDPDATLTIVGSTDTPLYGKAFDELRTRRGLNDCVRHLVHADLEELRDAYLKASVFVTASEHEGFCVPIVESMAMGIPVVAVGAAAVPETTSNAAELIDSADAYDLADAVARVHIDGAYRELLIKRGHERAEHFHPGTSAVRYAEYVQRITQ